MKMFKQFTIVYISALVLYGLLSLYHGHLLYPGPAAVTVLLGLVIISFWGLERESARVHGDLDKIFHRAVAATTHEELGDLLVELVDYSAKNCWHRAYGDHARSVMYYIQGRRKDINFQ